MFHKIVANTAFVALLIGGCAMDSDSYIPFIICGIAGIVLLIEGRFVDD